jgi:hypothetical protein
MKFETIRQQVQRVPFTHLVNARRLYDWVIERAPERILEGGRARHRHLLHGRGAGRVRQRYSWFLHDEIKRQTSNEACEPNYDSCVIFGSKNWTIDGGRFSWSTSYCAPEACWCSTTIPGRTRSQTGAAPRPTA